LSRSNAVNLMKIGTRWKISFSFFDFFNKKLKIFLKKFLYNIFYRFMYTFLYVQYSHYKYFS
jgi:hypothetical protein